MSVRSVELPVQACGICGLATLNVLSDAAAVKIVESVLGQSCERPTQLGLSKRRAGRWCRALNKKVLTKSHKAVKLCAFCTRRVRLAATYRKAVIRKGDCRREKALSTQASTKLGADLDGHLPTGDRSSNRIGGQCAARRYRQIAQAMIGVYRRRRSGGAAGIDTDRLAARRKNQPKGVPAQRVHMGIDNSDCSGRRNHRFDRVATFAHDVASGFSREKMRCDSNAPAPAQWRCRLTHFAPCLFA